MGTKGHQFTRALCAMEKSSSTDGEIQNSTTVAANTYANATTARIAAAAAANTGANSKRKFGVRPYLYCEKARCWKPVYPAYAASGNSREETPDIVPDKGIRKEMFCYVCACMIKFAVGEPADYCCPVCFRGRLSKSHGTLSIDCYM